MRDSDEPTCIDVGLAWLVVQSTAVYVTVRRKMDLAWFWLTYSVDCCVCGRRLRQAWLPWLKGPVPGTKRISHTYCRDCFESQFVNLSVRARQ